MGSNPPRLGTRRPQGTRARWARRSVCLGFLLTFQLSRNLFRPRPQEVPIPFELPALVIAELQHQLSLGLEFFHDAPLQLLHDRGRLLDLLVATLFDQSFQARRPLTGACFKSGDERIDQLGMQREEGFADMFVIDRSGGLRLQRRLKRANPHPLEPPIAIDLASSLDDLFVDAMTVGAGHDQSSVHRRHRAFETVRYLSCGDALKALLRRLAPHLGAEEAETHLGEPVAEVTEHYVVAVTHDRRVERDRPDPSRERMLEPLCSMGPRPCKAWEVEETSSRTSSGG